MPVAFMVIPIFALANAGIPIEVGALGETLSNPVVLGVSLGLILGKFIGITSASWLAIRFGLAVLYFVVVGKTSPPLIVIAIKPGK